MNLSKGALAFVLFLLINACTSDDDRILVGLEAIEKSQRTGEYYHFDDDRIFLLSQDSIEVIPLSQGCILSPAGARKFELYEEDDSRYAIVDGDTINADFDHLRGSLFSHRFDVVEYRCLSAVDIVLDAEYFEIIEMIEGNTFDFSIDDFNYSVSFYEEEVCIINRETEKDEFINRGLWFVRQLGNSFFLIIDGPEKILKFQLSGFSSKSIKAYSFNNEKREEITFSKSTGIYAVAESGVWTSNRMEEGTEDWIPPAIVNSTSGVWLSQNDKFIVHDSFRISNSYLFTYAHIDWNINAIVVDYNVVFDFDIDFLDRRKLKLYPTDENGKVDKLFSKVYYLE